MAGPAQAPGLGRAGAPCRRGAGRRRRHAGDRRGRELSQGISGSMEATTLAFKDNAHAALADPVLQSALARIKTGWVANRARAAEPAAGVRGAARPGPRHQEPQPGPSRPLPRGVRGQGRRAGGGSVHWARDAAEARAVVLELCQCGRRPPGDQEQEHDHRGDRAQPLPRVERAGAGRDRSRRVHPADLAASRRATSSAPRST